MGRIRNGSRSPGAPGRLLDLLRVAAIVLDAESRIVFRCPEAERLFGCCAAEALGEAAAPLPAAPENRRLAIKPFGHVQAGKVFRSLFFKETPPQPDITTIESAMRRMLQREPVSRQSVGRAPVGPDHDHALDTLYCCSQDDVPLVRARLRPITAALRTRPHAADGVPPSSRRPA